MKKCVTQKKKKYMNFNTVNNINKLLYTNMDALNPDFNTIKYFKDQDRSQFNSFVDKRKILGAYLIECNDKNIYWLVFLEWEKDEYAIAVYSKDKKQRISEFIYTSMTIATGEKSKTSIIWSYKPQKKDRKDKKRKELFDKYYGETYISISVPNTTNELSLFLKTLFKISSIVVLSNALDYTKLPEEVTSKLLKKTIRKPKEKMYLNLKKGIPPIAREKILLLREILEKIKQKEFVTITRLQNINVLCKNPRALMQFAYFISLKVDENFQKCATNFSQEELDFYNQYAVDAIKKMEAYLEKPSSLLKSQLEKLLNKFYNFQNETNRIHWTKVRNISNWDLLLIEEAIACFVIEDHKLGYKLARSYSEKYNSSIGTGLIIDSVKYLTDIIEFWENYCIEVE